MLGQRFVGKQVKITTVRSVAQDQWCSVLKIEPIAMLSFAVLSHLLSMSLESGIKE